jgi:catalase
MAGSKKGAGRGAASAEKSTKAATRGTSSGPSHPAPVKDDALALKAANTQSLVEAMPFNAAKAAEYALDGPAEAPEGEYHDTPQDVAGSSLSEANGSAKTGEPATQSGYNGNTGSLDRVRVNAGGQALTTNQGMQVGDNQNSLKAGLRGPTLLEDFILREKITHFDHERIPERIVHARGSGAHGYFEAYEARTDITKAAPFREPGKITPVFVRFSTVAGERGAMDTARDVRGFAVKFYTDEGNWDIVGNNMPVFFIQDAIKFPDLIHAVKPEPHHGMPQGASAHDTFWDFVSLMPESTHMLMWVMSDRAIPRSYRMMEGFGVHTFRLINEAGDSTFVKFHWKPLLGTHSLVWDEAVKIGGADPDFHRRDLWEAIESGNYPEWELGFQLFTEEQAEGFTFDVLDSTKLIPEELVPVTPVGRMVLNRNPDNFFAETEQVAFGTGNIIPGIDFSNDPLLAGRNHSYLDTQTSRLGGQNFHEIPINASLAPVYNNQRDGMHRQAIARGRVSYEPNSLGGGCPFQAGAKGFMSFPERIADDKVRGKPEKFADHYTQATLFFDSQTEQEKAHIVGGFRFELSKLTVPAIRTRMLSGLMNASMELAQQVADGLGMALPDTPMPRVLETVPEPEVTLSPALSLTARPGDGSIRTRKVAILVAPGADGASIEQVQAALLAEGAVPMLVGPRLGTFESSTGPIEAAASMENTPAVLFDALVLPDGAEAVDLLLRIGNTMEFVKDQYRHCKSILALGASSAILDKAGIEAILPNGDEDPGLFIGGVGLLDDFVRAIGVHRHPERDMDPPLV